MSQGGGDPFWVRDVKELRVELPSTGSRTPLTAAYELGRVCNEMRFRFQRVWITHNDEESVRTIHLWDESNRLIRRIWDELESNADAAIEDAKKSWEAMFTSEWYDETFAETLDNLNRHRFDHEDSLFGATEVDHLAHFCEPVTDVFRRMVNIISQAMSENLRVAVELGKRVDQLIHPALCSRIVCVIRPSRELLDWKDALNQPTQQRDQALTVPNQRVQPWPRLDARLAIESLYAELRERIPGQPGCAIPEWDGCTKIARIMDDVAACFEFTEGGRAEASNSDSVETSRLTQPGTRLARRFGLTLDIQNRQLQSVQLTTRQPLEPRFMKLIVFFLNRGELPTPTALLSENWHYFVPKNPQISRDSVITAISKLNDRLRDHGVEIHSGDGGYVIRNIPI